MAKVTAVSPSQRSRKSAPQGRGRARNHSPSNSMVTDPPGSARTPRISRMSGEHTDCPVMAAMRPEAVTASGRDAPPCPLALPPREGRFSRLDGWSAP